MRTCRTCNKEQDISEFYVTKKNDCKNGLYINVHCKTCDRLKGKTKFRYTKYRVTNEEYELMYNIRNGHCDICDNMFEVLCIDHCHNTKKVRGLLCKRCNSSLGYLDDRLDLAENAASYLKNYA